MTIEQSISQWTKAPFDKATIAEVEILKQNPTALEDAFYKEIEFGTGGMRGIMGAGTNRINQYTLGKASQGLANYLNSKKESSTPKVVIAYDSLLALVNDRNFHFYGITICKTWSINQFFNKR